MMTFLPESQRLDSGAWDSVCMECGHPLVARTVMELRWGAQDHADYVHKTGDQQIDEHFADERVEALLRA